MGYKTVSGYMKKHNIEDAENDNLYEKILVLNPDGTENTTDSGVYYYFYNADGTKIYTKTPGDFSNLDNLFLYKDNKIVGIGTANVDVTYGANKYNESFSGEFEEVIRKIAESGAVPVKEDGTDMDLNEVSFTSCSEIFDTDNAPEEITSAFNEHKRAVIQRSIKSNLYTAMANFSRNSLSSYEFRMPEIDETEWDKVVGNVGVIAFMQGIPMGNKYYNDYCIVSNNNNKEFVSEESIYIVVKNDITDLNEKGTYHIIGCAELNSVDIGNCQGYLNIDFRRQTVKVDESTNKYYYPQEAQACYNCIVSQNGVIDRFSDTSFRNSDLGKLFYRALAREKYNLYKVNNYLNDA